MSSFANHLDLRQVKADVLGGITASIAALPLALAFGLASGIGAMAGLYGAIATGFFAGLLGGTRTQISGPTGPMTIVFATVITQHAENVAEAFAIVILGGAFQVMLGTAKLGRYIKFTPNAVVSGFMSGIGVIIILAQLAPFFGAETASDPIATVSAIPSIALNANGGATLVGTVVLALCFAWPKSWDTKFPSLLVAMVAGTLLALFLFPSAPQIGPVPAQLPTISIPNIDLLKLPSFIQPAFLLALLGSIDSLLASLVADAATGDSHDSDKELIGQGIGNVAAGLLGALPGAGATMRTMVNIKAGGQTRLSSVVHSIGLLVIALGGGQIVGHIPQAVLAGILMKVGWDIIDWKTLARLHRIQHRKAVIVLLTLLLTVFTDLLTAVVIGIILAAFVSSAFRQTEEVSRIKQKSVTVTDWEGGYPNPTEGVEHELLELRFSGLYSSASARSIIQLCPQHCPENNTVYLNLGPATGFEYSASMAVEQLMHDLVKGGHTLFVTQPRNLNAEANLSSIDFPSATIFVRGTGDISSVTNPVPPKETI